MKNIEKISAIYYYNGRNEKMTVGICFVNTHWWICTNESTLNGDTAPDKLGYAYSWSMGDVKFELGKLITYDSSRQFMFFQPSDTNYQLVMSKKLFLVINNSGASINVKGKIGEAKLIIENWYEYDNYVYVDKEIANKGANSFDIRKGEISYFNGVQPVNENNKWPREGRQVMKASKFINSLKEYITVTDPALLNRAIEVLAERLKVDDGLKIEVSPNIVEVYKMPISKIESGSLEGSCMNKDHHNSGHDYLSIYEAMGAKIAYILDNNGDLSARALLWEDVTDFKSATTFKYMDRIYGSERHIETMKIWAEENGFGYKSRQCYDDPTVVLPNGTIFSKFYKHLNKSIMPLDGAPFVDTLCKLSAKGDKIGTVEMDFPYRMQNTDGEIDGYEVEEITCPNCGEELDSLNEICQGEGCTSCMVYSEPYERYIFRRAAITTHDGDYVLDNDEEYIQPEDASEIYNISELTRCSGCGGYYLTDVIQIAGNYYCHDCENSLESTNDEETNKMEEIKC
jgi:hypothetical protein